MYRKINLQILYSWYIVLWWCWVSSCRLATAFNPCVLFSIFLHYTFLYFWNVFILGNESFVCICICTHLLQIAPSCRIKYFDLNFLYISLGGISWCCPSTIPKKKPSQQLMYPTKQFCLKLSFCHGLTQHGLTLDFYSSSEHLEFDHRSSCSLIDCPHSGSQDTK